MKRHSKLKGAKFGKEWWDGAETDKWNEEGKKLYLGKYFYEIVKAKGHSKLYGPLKGINYVSGDSVNYKFVQIYNSKPVATFTDNEILVTDKLL